MAVEHFVGGDRVDLDRRRAEVEDGDAVLSTRTAAEPDDETRWFGHDRRDIAGAANKHLSNGRYPEDHLYGDGRAGARVATSLRDASLRIDKRLAY